MVAVIHRLALSCILLMLLVAVVGCGETATPSPAPQTATALPAATTPPPAPTATETSTLVSPTPTIQPSSAFVQPVAEAAIVELPSWSLTGDWLAYWLATARDIAGNPHPSSPATLNFLNARTLEACSAPQFVARNYRDYCSRLVWQPDGSVVVLSEGTSFQGMPCKNDFVAMPEPSDLPKSQDPALSPGGIYRAETTSGDRTHGTNITTTIVSTSNGRVVNTVSWPEPTGLGGVGLGGEWVTDSRFLIRRTGDQGPLLINAGKNVVKVVPALFKQLFVPGTDDYRATASVLANTDTFHLALVGTSLTVGSPHSSLAQPIRLYHSETGVIERLPFHGLWSPSFSPDGRWLLMDEQPIRRSAERPEGYGSNALWIRPIDASNREMRYVGEGTSRWTADWRKVVFVLESSVSVLTFPEGEPLGTWNVSSQFNLYPRAWSPSGEFIAVTATSEQGRGQQALFIIDVER